jgi:DNA invertase Pin-like site-specific DNA recombinase
LTFDVCSNTNPPIEPLLIEPPGRADAKAKGVKFGRKPQLTPHRQREAIRRRDVDEETLRSIGRRYNVSPQTISRLR